MNGIKFLNKNQDISKNLDDIRGFKSELDYYDIIEKRINKYIAKIRLDSAGSDSINKNINKPPKLSKSEFFTMILNVFDFAYLSEYNEDQDTYINTYYEINPNDPILTYRKINVAKMVTFASGLVDVTDIVSTIKDITTRLNNISVEHINKKLPDNSKIKKLNIAPSYIVLAPNGVLNIKTFEFSNNRDEFGKFDFLFRIDFRILPKKSINKLMIEIVKRIHNDWAEKDEESIIYLKQLEIAALEGNGRGVYNILKGEGGNGKSTFLFMLEHLAGRKYTTELDLHKLMDDNSLERVDKSNKLIVGHDLATNTKMSEAMLSRFKVFTTGENFQINVKYKPNQLCQTKGLKIQSTNSDISFFENSFAIKRRLNMFEWTNKSFTSLTDEENSTFNLAELVGGDSNPNTEFYEALIYYMFEDMSYFDKFDLPKKSKDKTESMVNDADQVYLFMEWLSERDLCVGKILSTNLYKMYTFWLKQENSSGNSLKKRAFTERLKKLDKTFNFELNTNKSNYIRQSSLSDLECNIELLNNQYFNNSIIPLKREQASCIIFNNQISDDELNSFSKYIEDNNVKYEDLSYKQLLMLHHLIKNNQNIQATAIFASATD